MIFDTAVCNSIARFRKNTHRFFCLRAGLMAPSGSTGPVVIWNGIRCPRPIGVKETGLASGGDRYTLNLCILTFVSSSDHPCVDISLSLLRNKWLYCIWCSGTQVKDRAIDGCTSVYRAAYNRGDANSRVGCKTSSKKWPTTSIEWYRLCRVFNLSYKFIRCLNWQR